MDEGRGLQCATTKFAAQTHFSQPQQVVVNYGSEPLQGRGITATPIAEELRDIARTLERSWTGAGVPDICTSLSRRELPFYPEMTASDAGDLR